jgi:hypothetical protein
MNIEYKDFNDKFKVLSNNIKSIDKNIKINLFNKEINNEINFPLKIITKHSYVNNFNKEINHPLKIKAIKFIDEYNNKI